jgi:hypothetical protein
MLCVKKKPMASLEAPSRKTLYASESYVIPEFESVVSNDPVRVTSALLQGHDVYVPFGSELDWIPSVSTDGAGRGKLFHPAPVQVLLVCEPMPGIIPTIEDYNEHSRSGVWTCELRTAVSMLKHNKQFIVIHGDRRLKKIRVAHDVYRCVAEKVVKYKKKSNRFLSFLNLSALYLTTIAPLLSILLT